MARSKTSLLFVLQDSSPSHSSVSTVESIFGAFQLLAHSPWVLASPGGSLKCESHVSHLLGLII